MVATIDFLYKLGVIMFELIVDGWFLFVIIAGIDKLWEFIRGY